MLWRTSAVCVVCVVCAFLARELLLNTPSPAQETPNESARNSSSSRPTQPAPPKSSPVQKVETSRQPQPKAAAPARQHIHHVGGHEGCADCASAALVEKPTTPISLAVRNLQAENCFTHVTSILSNTEGVTVGHACAESGRIDLLYAPGKVNMKAISETLTQGGITVDGNLVTLRVDGPIEQEQEQQLKTKIQGMDGVELRNLTSKSGRIELVISHATTTQSDVAQTLRQMGYKVK